MMMDILLYKAICVTLIYSYIIRTKRAFLKLESKTTMRYCFYVQFQDLLEVLGGAGHTCFRIRMLYNRMLDIQPDVL